MRLVSGTLEWEAGRPVHMYQQVGGAVKGSGRQLALNIRRWWGALTSPPGVAMKRPVPPPQEYSQDWFRRQKSTYRMSRLDAAYNSEHRKIGGATTSVHRNVPVAIRYTIHYEARGWHPYIETGLHTTPTPLA